MSQTEETKKANKDLYHKAFNIFWGLGGGVNIREELSEYAKKHNGWIDESPWVDINYNTDFGWGLKLAESSGLRLAWPQEPMDEPGLANLYSISVIYHSDGRLEIVSAAGRTTVPAFTSKSMLDACANPVVERVDCPANRKANLEYIEKALAAFEVIRPVFKRYYGQCRMKSEVDEYEISWLSSEYARGYAKVTPDYAHMRMSWKQNFKLKPSNSGWDPSSDLRSDSCSVTLTYLEDDGVVILSGLPWKERLSREQWSNADLMFTKLDRHFKDPLIM
jgi:hypothetical protein